MSETSRLRNSVAGQENSGLSFCVGEVAIEILSEISGFRASSEREAFEYSARRPDLSLRIRRAGLAARPPGRLVFDSEAVWRAYRDGRRRVFRFSSPSLGADPYKELRIDEECCSGEIILNEEYKQTAFLDPLEYPLDELLVVDKLGTGLGCELHSCGIVDEDGLGWLFCGHSGAGKSTLARLWSRRNITVLSDDRIILRRWGHDIRMYGTPWHGEAGFALPASVPLQGIFIIEHGARNLVELMEPIAAVSELMARTFLLFHEEGAVQTTLSFLGDVVDSTPCRRFSFVPDESAIDALSELMWGGCNA